MKAARAGPPPVPCPAANRPTGPLTSGPGAAKAAHALPPGTETRRGEAARWTGYPFAFMALGVICYVVMARRDCSDPRRTMPMWKMTLLAKTYNEVLAVAGIICFVLAALSIKAIE